VSCQNSTRDVHHLAGVGPPASLGSGGSPSKPSTLVQTKFAEGESDLSESVRAFRVLKILGSHGDSREQRKLDSVHYVPEIRREERLRTELDRIGRINGIKTNVGRSLSSSLEEWYDVSAFDDLDKVGSLGDVDICDNEDTDVSLIYYYHKLVHPPEAYKEFLDHLSVYSRKPYPALGRFTGLKCWEHDNGCRVILPEIETEKYNPADKFQSIRASASRTASQLMNLKWLPSSDENKKALVSLDLTFPKEISEKMLGGVGYLEDRFWSVYKSFLEKFNETKGAYDVANSSNLHVWSSQDPLSPHGHFHSVFIWAKRIGNCLKPLSWHDKSKPVDPARVKALWAESINEEFGTSYCSDKVAYETGTTWLNSLASGGSVSPVVVESSWIPLSPNSYWVKDKDNSESYIRRKIIHRLKYCRRKPLTDLGEFYTDNEFDKSQVDIGFALDLVEYGNSSRQFGFWTRLKKCVNTQESESEVKDICPVCGEECEEAYSLSRDKYSPDMLVKIGKRGSVYRGEPPPDHGRLNLNSTQRAVPTLVPVHTVPNGEVEELGVIEDGE